MKTQFVNLCKKLVLTALVVPCAMNALEWPFFLTKAYWSPPKPVIRSLEQYELEKVLLKNEKEKLEKLTEQNAQTHSYIDPVYATFNKKLAAVFYRCANMGKSKNEVPTPEKPAKAEASCADLINEFKNDTQAAITQVSEKAQSVARDLADINTKITTHTENLKKYRESSKIDPEETIKERERAAECAERARIRAQQEKQKEFLRQQEELRAAQELADKMERERQEREQSFFTNPTFVSMKNSALELDQAYPQAKLVPTAIGGSLTAWKLFRMVKPFLKR